MRDPRWLEYPASPPLVSSSITMDGEDNGNYIAIEEFPDPEGAMPRLRRFKSFAPGYFETMGNRLVAGRSITWGEIYEQRPVIVISAPLAREYWGAPARALGKRVRTGPRNPWREIVGGIGVALVITRVMAAFLFGVGPMDPMTYAGVSGALACVALLATYLPAHRAARVDPVVALRADV